MFRELLDIFNSKPPLQEASRELASMMQEAQAMALDASAACWGGNRDGVGQTMAERDRRIGDHQQSIRQAVAVHFTVAEHRSMSFGLKLMSIVKDVERIGDYSKNLVKIPGLVGSPEERQLYQFVEDPPVALLVELVRTVDEVVRAMPEVFEAADVERAGEITRRGRALAQRFDEVLRGAAQGDYSPDVVVNLTLTTRYYKRILGHHLNILTAVTMPLDRLDTFDPIDPV